MCVRVRASRVRPCVRPCVRACVRPCVRRCVHAGACVCDLCVRGYDHALACEGCVFVASSYASKNRRRREEDVGEDEDEGNKTKKRKKW